MLMIFKKIRNFFCRGGRWFRQRYRRFLGKHGIIKKRGIKLLNRILSEKSPNDAIFFAGSFMGGALYALAYVKAYKEQNPDKRVIVLAPEKLRYIVEGYEGYDKLVCLPKRKAWRMRYLFDNADLSDETISLASANNVMCLRLFFDNKFIGTDLLSFKREKALSVGENAAIQFHHVTEVPVTAIDNFDTVCDKVVIFNAASTTNHFGKESARYFAQISEYLVEKGYLVYTNIINDQLPISGSKELRCGLPELLSIARRIPLIVSIRSGVLDFLIKTDINMFVIYPNNPPFMSAYALSGWQCGGRIKEITQNDVKNDADLTIFKQFLSEIESGGEGAPAETD